MRVGVLMLPTDPWPETVARAQRLEAMGYDHLWTYDHLSWRHFRGRPWYGALPWLTGIAAATNRVEIGPMVTSPNFRNPVALAQEAVTVDHVSGGRFVLGVGAGGIGFDATVFGNDPLSPGERAERLAEFVGVLDRLFREPTVSHAGRYFTLHEACVRPAAVRVPRVPIAIAAGGAKTLALVARLGDAWITLGDIRHIDAPPAVIEAGVREQVRRLDESCAALGRDPATIRRIYLIGVTTERPLASAEAFRDFAGRYAALGFTDLVFHHPRPDDPARNEPESVVEDIAATLTE